MANKWNNTTHNSAPNKTTHNKAGNMAKHLITVGDKKSSQWCDTQRKNSQWCDTQRKNAQWCDTQRKNAQWSDTQRKNLQWCDTQRKNSQWCDTQRENSQWCDTQRKNSQQCARQTDRHQCLKSGNIPRNEGGQIFTSSLEQSNDLHEIWLIQERLWWSTGSIPLLTPTIVLRHVVARRLLPLPPFWRNVVGKLCR